MHRLLIDTIEGDAVILAGEQHHRATRVLRLRHGDRLRIFDGRGHEYEAIIEASGRSEATLRLGRAVQPIPEPAIRITLFQSIPRGDAMERVIQKAVEIGVAEIVPVITRRTVARTPGGEGSKLARWRKIALHAVEQSGRAYLVPVAEPLSFDAIVQHVPSFDLALVPHVASPAISHSEPLADRHSERSEESCSARGELREACPPGRESRPAPVTPIRAVLAAVVRPALLAVLIGPEGGFAPEEVERLAAAGARVLSLGPRVLRSETAGLVTAAIVLYHFGEMG